MSTNNGNRIDVQLPIGLYTDSEPDKQPKDTYRFGLNVVRDTEEGSKGSVSNERGNELCTELPGATVGIIPMGPDRQAYFTDDGSISVFHPHTCTLEIVVSQLFSFSTNNHITGEHRVVRGCEDVIYWRNSVDPDRYFNFSRPEKFQDDSGNFLISLFDLNYRAAHPAINAEPRIGGGRLPLGNYFFVVEYLDDFNNVLFSSPPTTDPVTITDNDEDGGLNIETNLAQAGGVPLASKSIYLEISNISPEISFLRLGVLRAITGDGQTFSAHYVSTPIVVLNGTAQFTYTGFNPSSGDTPIDFRTLVDKAVIYDSCDYMEQVQGRLVRFALRESTNNYSEFQKFASKICVEYVTKDIALDQIADVRTEIGGEVRDYGIVFIFGNGQVSNVFHIPGPPLPPEFEVEEDTRCIIVTASMPDTCAGGAVFYTLTYTVNGGTPQQWSRHIVLTPGSTGTSVVSNECFTSDDVVVITGFTYEFLGEPCEGVQVSHEIVDTPAPNDNWRNISTATPDPDFDPETSEFSSRGTMGYFTSGQVYVSPPNYCGDDFWGVDCNGDPLLGELVRYHVMPDRIAEPLTIGTGEDRLVRIIGAEFTNIEYPPGSGVVGHYFVGSIRSPSTSLIAAKGLALPFDNEAGIVFGRGIVGGYLNQLGSSLEHTSGGVTGNLVNFISPEYLFNREVPTGIKLVQEGTYAHTDVALGNLTIFDNYFSESVPQDRLVLSRWEYELNEYVQGIAATVSVQDVINSYSIDRRSTVSNILNPNYTARFNILNVIFDNPSEATGRYFRYVSLKRQTDVFPNLFSNRYRRLSNEPNESILFEGDGYISPFSITSIADLVAEQTGAGSGQTFLEVVFNTLFHPYRNLDTIYAYFEYIHDLFIESTVNPALRHSGTTLCNQYYDGLGDLNTFIADKVTESIDGTGADTGTGGSYKLRDSLCSDWYGYNRDFSRLQDIDQYTPLPFTWDYCSACIGLQLNSYIWSEKSFQDDRGDNYRVYLPNNFNTIISNKGPIVAANYKEDKIIIRTLQSAFFIHPNPQQLQTSEETVLIGTGDFLSLPERELNVTDIGWGGQQHPLESIDTEHGLIWIDRSRGKIFRLHGQITEISRQGMYHWLTTNLSSDGDICILTYDPVVERLILTRKDMFTLSYSFATESWISWHSYKPSFYTFYKANFFSELDNVLWKHNADTFHHFYGVAYPFTFEYIVNEFTSIAPASVYYYVRMLKWNEDALMYVEDQNIDFDSVLVYNKNQSSGVENLVLNSNGTSTMFYNAGENYVTKTDEMSKISRIFDKSTSDAVFQLVAFTSDQGYLDKVPLDVDIDTPQANQGMFNGKFLAVRLTLNKNEYKCVLNLVATLKHYHNR